MERSPSGVGPALALCLLLLALSAPGPAEGRLLKGAGAVQAAVGAGAPQEPFFLRMLKGLLTPQQPLTPQVDAPGDSTRPASTAGGAGIMASTGSAKTRQNVCHKKNCPGVQHCLPRKHRGHWWGKCVCPKGFKKPAPDSPQCVPCCECLSGSGEPSLGSNNCVACGRAARCSSTGQPMILPIIQPAPPPTPTLTPRLTPTLTPAPAPTNLNPGGNISPGGETCASKFDAQQCKFNQELLDLTNNLRRTMSLADLCLNNKLIASAKGHTKDMVANFLPDPEKGSDGSSSFQRIRQAGFNIGYRENTAYGRYTVDDVFNHWVLSPPHYAALVATNVDMMGAWMIDGKWTQDFGNSTGDPTRPTDVCNTNQGVS